jgi:hypothetical protein
MYQSIPKFCFAYNEFLHVSATYMTTNTDIIKIQRTDKHKDGMKVV